MNVKTFEDNKKFQRRERSRFQRHMNILIWKSYLQRQRRWRILLIETFFAGILFLSAIFIAKPVFLTPLQEEPTPPLSSSDILSSLSKTTILGYAPNTVPYSEIMNSVSATLNMDIMEGETEDDLNNMLYTMSKMKPITTSVIWVIWKPNDDNMWQLSIRSTERARYATSAETSSPNPHLRAGFLAVQLAISQAIVGKYAKEPPDYEVNLISMPVSPLMQEYMVRIALSRILLCFTIALIPPVLETEALVVHETGSRLKRALRMRGVDYSAMYIGWLVYAYLTAIPICFLASVSLILIFRWIHLIFAMLLLSAYIMVMIMLALIMAMFHTRALIACIWSTMFTLLQTYLAELLIHHQYDEKHGGITILLHVLIPPLGLVNAFNQFALLQTGRGRVKAIGSQSLSLTIGSWTLVIMFYFVVLMLMQRTLRQGGGVIGGQVSWKSVIFKTVEDVEVLRPIETPTGKERDNLQEVDEHVAKAVSFINVSKTIMGEQVLRKITMDVYRGEYTMLFCERIQEKMMMTFEDLLVGLTHPDSGSIFVLGQRVTVDKNYLTECHMLGYCHREKMLIEDITVEEHLVLFFDISMWQESREYITEYSHMRMRRLMADYDLEIVRNVRVGRLHYYYRAQLCWAIAMLLEPRVILVPNFLDHPNYTTVIKDKIMTHKKYFTIVKTCYTSIQLEYADRVFVFDSKVVAFGGTPAYMFFKYGREYRVRMTLRSDGTDNEATSALLARAAASGATVRAHLGSLLILRLPATPTHVVADLMRDLTNNANEYALTSLNVTVADSEEVYKRTIYQCRESVQEAEVEGMMNEEVLRKIGTDRVPWKRKISFCTNTGHLRNIGWKVFAYYLHYRFFFIITVIIALVTGIFMGLSFSTMLRRSERDNAAKKLLHGDVLTIEAMEQETVLMIRADRSAAAESVARAYVLSEPKATEEQLKSIVYSALSRSESLTDYLITRAIDAPQLYVYLYAYGLDIYQNSNRSLVVNVMYSPLHFDQGAAARSMAKAYTALLRHYTQQFDASIQITDDPLALDLTPWMQYATKPPLVVQFLLILSITHITFIPSKEHGLISHMQKHALNFSPARYWFTLYFCDVIMYWVLVVLMTVSMMFMMYFSAPRGNFHYEDLLVVPFMLIVYGVVCVPQAYLFSFGPRVALNSMIFVIVNLIFGETTILAKIFFGDTLHIALLFMSLSPQYNMAYAFVKIKQIFLYNTECIIFESQKLCSSKTLHKCCQKCGVLQECFYRKTYLAQASGVRTELIAMLVTSFIFMSILLLVEYKVFRRLWRYTIMWMLKEIRSNDDVTSTSAGTSREKKDVLDKRKQIKLSHNEKVDTFGEYLLAKDISKKEMGLYTVHSVYLGLGKGEALALGGLKRHGRQTLCDILAGSTMPSDGLLFCMSRWRHDTQPHNYACQISYSCARNSLPPWMTVTDGLELLACLRGVPRRYVQHEVRNYIDVLDLSDIANVLISRISENQRTRLHFAAAVVGAPPIIIVDECTAYQKFSIRRVMYYILYHLRKRGHAIVISSASVESHLPVTNRLAIIMDGTIFDIDTVDNLVARYSKKGLTVVVHLKQEVVISHVHIMFACHFREFTINDATEVLVNVQVLDPGLNWATIFERMEAMKSEYQEIYSYIITAIPIDYIYNSIINNERGKKVADDFISSFKFMKKSIERKVCPSHETMNNLMKQKQKYDITTLKELPWSVIFHR